MQGSADAVYVFGNSRSDKPNESGYDREEDEEGAKESDKLSYYRLLALFLYESEHLVVKEIHRGRHNVGNYQSVEDSLYYLYYTAPEGYKSERTHYDIVPADYCKKNDKCRVKRYRIVFFVVEG